MTKSIIFITGYAGSGKDYVGTILAEKGYKRYAFADMLKIHVADVHGFDLALAHTQSGKQTTVLSKKTNTPETVRNLLIEESAKAKEMYNDQAFWARILEKLIKTDPPEKVVITDWRYEAEITHFKAEFPTTQFHTIRVVRDSVTPSTDPSEHNIDHIVCDYTIFNNQTTIDLKHKVTQLPI
jgi:hypothetical protein